MVMEALAMTKTCSPDVVLMDISMPGTGGIQATEKIRENFQNTKVVILTMHEDPVYVRSALAAGATGYIVKKAADSELISAIRAVYRGTVY